MSATISFPFRVLATGNVATVDEGSSEQEQELLAVLLLTRPGERQLVPDFGLDDPAFQGFSDAGLEPAIETFGPDVTIRKVEQSVMDASTQRVTVEFD